MKRYIRFSKDTGSLTILSEERYIVKAHTVKFVFSALMMACAAVFAGDLECYGYTSITRHFECNISPWNSGNCVWWAASKRPDLATAVDASGASGWDAGEWYDKLKTLGFPVGQTPQPGAIVEFVKPGPKHVAYIEKVYSDGSFDVKEMDAYGSNGFDPGLNHATYYPDGNGKYHRNNGVKGGWTLKGFIYAKGADSATDTTCDPLKRKCDIRIYGNVGWYPPVDICQNATQWFIIGVNAKGEKYSMGSRPNASACPMMCVAN